jgi:hypothetical protein
MYTSRHDLLIFQAVDISTETRKPVEIGGPLARISVAGGRSKRKGEMRDFFKYRPLPNTIVKNDPL